LLLAFVVNGSELVCEPVPVSEANVDVLEIEEGVLITVSVPQKYDQLALGTVVLNYGGSELETDLAIESTDGKRSVTSISLVKPYQSFEIRAIYEGSCIRHLVLEFGARE
jgi:hypothetical protein